MRQPTSRKGNHYRAALSMIEAMGDDVLEVDVERLTPLR
jgi:hypothetical protein